jgi:ribonuclease R
VSAGPAPASAFVAVLARRGRFLTAARLFERPRGDERERLPHGRGASGAIVLGSAGSKGPGREGELVLVQPPSRGRSARVVRKLGRPEVARDLLEALMLDRGLSRGFDAAVEREAREAGARVMASAEGRRDLRELATFTVDPVSARDFDDAISARREEGGCQRVWVHIADVAAHVPPGSLVDREALRRATSVYVPGAVEPMLPHALSSDACSLLPGVDRAAVTAELELDGPRVLSAAFYRSLIRSDERLDYERLDRIFAGRESAAEPWREPLAVAREVASALGAARAQSGALSLDAVEPEASFDARGNVEEIHGRVQTESHRLIEHLMIAANEAVASLLSQRRVPTLFRVHEPPEPDRVERLADQLASLGVPTPPLPEPMSPSQAAALLGAISTQLEKHLAHSEGRGRIALSSLVLRSLKQAYYSPRNVGHAGLRSVAYCHFTSPIRRYPDLVCHRALLSAVGGGEREPRAGELGELGVWTSERERAAMVVERDADRIVSCFALERELRAVGLGHRFEGEVTGLISAGAFVAFAGAAPSAVGAPPFEGMLPVRLLREGPARDWWELNEQGTILQAERSGATLKLGDPVRVRVGRVDTIRGRVDLEPAG